MALKGHARSVLSGAIGRVRESAHCLPREGHAAAHDTALPARALHVEGIAHGARAERRAVAPALHHRDSSARRSAEAQRGEWQQPVAAGNSPQQPAAARSSTQQQHAAAARSSTQQQHAAVAAHSGRTQQQHAAAAHSSSM